MNKERLTTFVDAVLAIIMTILVLELRQPDPVSLEGFLQLKENFFAYTLSFFWLGTMWVNLHNEWYRIKRINVQIIWATIVMLFFSTLFPYATSIVSENFNNEAAQGFYGIIVILITISNYVSYQELAKENGRDSSVVNQIQDRNHWLYLDIIIKIIGLIISLLFYPPAMMYSVLLTLLVLVIPNQIKNARKKTYNEPKE